MSQRKTKKWTDKLEDAYHDTAKGRPGELAVIKHLELSGCQRIIDWESNKEVQQNGIDISYNDEWNRTITIQVKENYIIETPVVKGAPAPRYFYIENHNEPKHISCVKADLMVHVNMERLEFIMYPTEIMVAAVDLHNHANEECGQYTLSNGVRLIRIMDNRFDWFIHGMLLTSLLS